MTGVHLKNVKFHAHHGVYAGEEKTGGPFEVTLSVWYHSPLAVTGLHQTVNYVELFDIINQRMQQPTALLETIATDVCDAVKNKFPFVDKIEISIDKLAPPIENFEGKTGITFQKTY
jgi:7,8-dihydroneopterin aldolase/epimerase/oxygenase